MKRRLILVVAVATSVVAASTASAAAPAEVHIRLHPAVFCCPEAGTWDASGAISDSGTFVRTDVHTTGSIPVCPTPLAHKAAYQEEFLLIGSQGTLTLKDETVVAPTEPLSCFGDITSLVWQIMGGTVAYDQTNAHGTGYFGPPLTLYLDGIAQVR
jgi:hypothetical protein